ncbi:zinc ribbon domain-containing protein [Humibacter sp.]|jgi:predicted  nucleic acid-binding Zn-ribbon protein|uniref:zinc ribbon domain-containing protein n=1 Tax=Humibacter sp. TaxID=1940291 RepID=UPI002CF68E4B|nr:C4-type zinc ribbon domain-containing protein [Humibacter sp.]HVX07260.1 C4-type zinc ribbon domain-containing protein [Humibacter sp.]
MRAVKADPRDQRELLRVHDLDTAITQATRAISHPSQDARLAELRPQAAEIRSRRLAVFGELEDARAELARLESDVEVVEARMKRDSERVQQTASVKDVAALESELEALRKRRSDLEDIELGIMERIEGLETQLSAIDAEAAEVESKVAALEAEREVEVESWERRRRDAAADREAVASALPEELVALYDKQRARYGVGAARLVGGVSLASNMKLSPSDLADVRSAADDDVVLCPDSGAILIRDENS